MKLKTWIVFAALAFLLVDLRAAAPVESLLVADGKKSAIRIRVTHALRVVLPTPTVMPGYEWQVLSNDVRFLRPTTGLKLVPAGDKAADKTDPAVQSWAVSFLALRPGRSILRVAYVRSASSGEEIPVEIREINVTVHNEPEPKAP
jgi:hypothetical protein